MLFHYDGRTSEWDDLEWSKRAIHVSTRKQTKWWYAKRFLHPDIVAPYDYLFFWDEDLGLENFDAEECNFRYIKLVRQYGLDISQPDVASNNELSWRMTKRWNDTDVHKETEERPGWCTDPHLPPCAGKKCAEYFDKQGLLFLLWSAKAASAALSASQVPTSSHEGGDADTKIFGIGPFTVCSRGDSFD